MAGAALLFSMLFDDFGFFAAGSSSAASSTGLARRDDDVFAIVVTGILSGLIGLSVVAFALACGRCSCLVVVVVVEFSRVIELGRLSELSREDRLAVAR